MGWNDKIPVINGNRLCGKCKQILPIDNFWMRKVGYYYAYCKSCTNNYCNQYRKNNPDKNKQYQKTYIKNHFEQDKRARRLNHVKRKFGLSVEEYDALVKLQEGICAICSQTNKSGKELAVDHDHNSGRVRGLLCENCNKSLGLINDDPVLVLKMYQYLINHSEETVSVTNSN